MVGFDRSNRVSVDSVFFGMETALPFSLSDAVIGDMMICRVEAGTNDILIER